MASCEPPADVSVEQNRASVALLGAGRMGAALAERLLNAGFATRVWNRTPGRTTELEGAGADVVETARAAVAGAHIVLTSVTDGDALVDILAGRDVMASMAGGVLVDLSTIGVAASRHVAVVCEEHGVGYVRAPVSGNPAVVRSGSATLFVSGAEAAIARCRSVLDAMAGWVKVLGEADEARVIKLAVNLVLAGTAELLAEAVVLGEAHDVDRGVLLSALNDSVLGSTFSRYKTEALLDRDYAATFTTADLAKDVGLVLHEAAVGGVMLPLAARMSELLGVARALGYSERDFISLLPALQQVCGHPADLPAQPPPSAGA